MAPEKPAEQFAQLQRSKRGAEAWPEQLVCVLQGRALLSTGGMLTCAALQGGSFPCPSFLADIFAGKQLVCDKY